MGSIEDTGELLSVLDIAVNIIGGKTALSASFDDTRRGSLLGGNVALTDFRIRNAPLMARLLEASTLPDLL
jgi:hypothetical protein